MTRYIIILLMFGFVGHLKTQVIDIPDIVFKDNLLNHLVADLNGNGVFDSDVDLNDNGEIEVSEAEQVIGLQLVINGVMDMTGIEYFTSLEVLRCQEQSISAINVLQNVYLKELSLSYNSLSDIDLSSNSLLEELYLAGNAISDLDISNNPNMKVLNVSNNNLSDLDVNANTNLEILAVGENNINALNVSQLFGLIELNIGNTPISTIDLSANIELLYLVVLGTTLTHLDLTQNKELKVLDCVNSMLQHLDLSNNNNLTHLYASDNDLNYVSVRNGNNTNMWVMNVENNEDLICIEVDDVIFAENQLCINGNQGWCKDETASYSEFCEFELTDQSIDSRLTIYPNPVSDAIIIYSQNGLEIQSIALYDIHGRKVKESIEVVESIDISNLTSGVYVIHVGTDIGIVKQMVIKK